MSEPCEAASEDGVISNLESRQMQEVISHIYANGVLFDLDPDLTFE